MLPNHDVGDDASHGAAARALRPVLLLPADSEQQQEQAAHLVRRHVAQVVQHREQEGCERPQRRGPVPLDEAAEYAQRRVHLRRLHPHPAPHVRDQAPHDLLPLHRLGELREQQRVQRRAQGAPGRVGRPQQPVGQVAQGDGEEAAERRAVAPQGLTQQAGGEPAARGLRPEDGVHLEAVVRGRGAARQEPHVRGWVAPAGGRVPDGPEEGGGEVGAVGEAVGQRLDREAVVAAGVVACAAGATAGLRRLRPAAAAAAPRSPRPRRPRPQAPAGQWCTRKRVSACRPHC